MAIPGLDYWQQKLADLQAARDNLLNPPDQVQDQTEQSDGTKSAQTDLAQQAQAAQPTGAPPQAITMRSIIFAGFAVQAMQEAIQELNDMTAQGFVADSFEWTPLGTPKFRWTKPS